MNKVTVDARGLACPLPVVIAKKAAEERAPIVSLTIRDYESAAVSDALAVNYGIYTRSGGHCAPLMHQALGTAEQGAVRFSFSYYNTMEEVCLAVSALNELAEPEETEDIDE